MENVGETDSSSSENEIPVNILKEVIDQQFLNDNLYISKETIVVPQYGELEINKSNKKSLRRSLKEDKFTNLGVTATFQNFIAKKLDEILERSIELKSNKIIQHCTEQKQKRKNSGIKLLSTSKKFLVISTSTEIYAKDKKKSEKCKNYHQFAKNKDTLLKFQEAAVDPEFIMGKSDTKAWINKRPEPEFKYKRLKNDILIEVQH